MQAQQSSKNGAAQFSLFVQHDPAGSQDVSVDRATEWKKEHVDGARLKPLDKLTTLLSDLDSKKPLAVYCKGGYRSAIATSLLQRAGYEQVMNVVRGFEACHACALPFVADRAR